MASTAAVIIPCYNYGRFLGECLESVRAQTRPPDEVLVVDDGSTDDTRDVCARFEGVRYQWKPNGGPSSARNFGIVNCSSAHMVFLDADDRLRSDAIEVLMSALREVGTPVGAVAARAETFSCDASGFTSQMWPLLSHVEPYISRRVRSGLAVLSRDVAVRVVLGNIFPACSTLVSRDAITECGVFDTDLGTSEDTVMWARITARFEVALVDCVIADIRKHDANMTRKTPTGRLRNDLNHLRGLQKVLVSDWAPAPLRAAARRASAAGAHRIGRALARRGAYSQAAGMLNVAVESEPSRIKSRILRAACRIARQFVDRTYLFELAEEDAAMASMITTPGDVR